VARDLAGLGAVAAAVSARVVVVILGAVAPREAGDAKSDTTRF
jgi:hypothetical protein